MQPQSSTSAKNSLQTVVKLREQLSLPSLSRFQQIEASLSEDFKGPNVKLPNTPPSTLFAARSKELFKNSKSPDGDVSRGYALNLRQDLIVFIEKAWELLLTREPSLLKNGPATQSTRLDEFILASHDEVFDAACADLAGARHGRSLEHRRSSWHNFQRWLNDEVQFPTPTILEDWRVSLANSDFSAKSQRQYFFKGKAVIEQTGVVLFKQENPEFNQLSAIELNTAFSTFVETNVERIAKTHAGKAAGLEGLKRKVIVSQIRGVNLFLKFCGKKTVSLPKSLAATRRELARSQRDKVKNQLCNATGEATTQKKSQDERLKSNQPPKKLAKRPIKKKTVKTEVAARARLTKRKAKERQVKSQLKEPKPPIVPNTSPQKKASATKQTPKAEAPTSNTSNNDAPAQKKQTRTSSPKPPLNGKAQPQANPSHTAEATVRRGSTTQRPLPASRTTMETPAPKKSDSRASQERVPRKPVSQPEDPQLKKNLEIIKNLGAQLRVHLRKEENLSADDLREIELPHDVSINGSFVALRVGFDNEVTLSGEIARVARDYIEGLRFLNGANIVQPLFARFEAEPQQF